MKNKKILLNFFIIALVIWSIMLIKQEINISQYKNEVKVLSQKIDIAEEKLQQNKENLEEEKQNINSLEYIEKLAREKLGMYLPNERVYIDSNL